MLITVLTLKQMDTYPLSGIVYVSLLLVFVLMDCQNVRVFPNQDLTSSCLKILYGIFLL